MLKEKKNQKRLTKINKANNQKDVEKKIKKTTTF